MATGDRDIRGDPRALGPDRGLGDLDYDFLALGEHGIDTRNGASPVSTSSSGPLLGVGVRVVEIVSDVEECGLIESDVDEGGLHARKDPAHPAFNDVSDNTRAFSSLDVEF